MRERLAPTPMPVFRGERPTCVGLNVMHVSLCEKEAHGLVGTRTKLSINMLPKSSLWSLSAVRALLFRAYS